jgi:hypothetical protein
MAWLKLGDEYPAQTKGLSDAAYRLHTNGLSWVMKHETDGLIERADLPMIYRSRRRNAALAELVAADYWRNEDGKLLRIVHGMDSQPSPDELVRRRELATSRSRSWRRKRLGLDTPQRTPPAESSSRDAVRDASRHALRDAHPSRPGPTRPVKGQGPGHQRPPDTDSGSASAGPPAKKKKRAPKNTDAEIRTYIRAALDRDPNAGVRTIENTIRTQGVRAKSVRLHRLIREEQAARLPRPKPEKQPCDHRGRNYCTTCRDTRTWLEAEFEHNRVEENIRRFHARMAAEKAAARSTVPPPPDEEAPPW